MGDYNRSTRELSLDTLSADVRIALQAHIEKHELGPVLNEVLSCTEALADKIKKGLFAGPGPRTSSSTLVLTPRWLFEVLRLDSQPLYVRSARLADVIVTDYEKSPFYARIPDSGVEVTGLFTDTAERTSSFIGLGKDPAGEKFKSALIHAVQQAKA